MPLNMRENEWYHNDIWKVILWMVILLYKKGVKNDNFIMLLLLSLLL